MVIRDGHCGTVFDEIPKLQPKFNPSGSVFSMMVGLIPGKEEHVGVNRFEVFEDLRARAFGPAGVTREVAYHKGVLIDRVLPD